jgi:hypothetical protein
VNQAFYYAKTEGLKHLSDQLGIQDTLLIYKIDTLEKVFRKSNADLNMYGGDFQQFFNAIMNSYNANNTAKSLEKGPEVKKID